MKILATTTAHRTVKNYLIAFLHNCVIDVNTPKTTLNITNYPKGLYKVALVVNGQIVDTKNLIKQ